MLRYLLLFGMLMVSGFGQHSRQTIRISIDNQFYPITPQKKRAFFALVKSAAGDSTALLPLYINYADAWLLEDNHDSARVYLRRAIAATSSFNTKAELGERIATTFLHEGRILEAITDKVRAATNADKAGNQNFRNAIHKSLKPLYDQIQNPEKAEGYFRQAIKDATAKRQTKRLHGIHFYYANFLADYYRHAEALMFYQKVERFAKSQSDFAYLAHIQQEMAQSLWKLKKKNAAIQKAEEAKRHWDNIQTSLKISKVHALLGHFYLKQQKLSLAMLELELAEKEQENLSLELRLRLYDDLSELYQKINDQTAAYSYIQLKKSYIDSVTQKETLAQVNNLELRLEAEQKDRELASQQARLDAEKSANILWFGTTFGLFLLVLAVSYILRLKQRANTLLTARKEKIEEQNAQIQQALDEKNVLIREVHHRVKNNLQVISSLLSLQADTDMDGKALAAIQESRDRVKSISILHQLLYQNNNVDVINIRKYIDQLVTFLRSVHQPPNIEIHFNIQMEELQLDVDTAVPLGVILNELVTNAFKYAFKDRNIGLVEISIQQLKENEYCLIVSDDGVGMNRSVDFDQLESLGLRIVSLLTRQLGGNISMKPSKGTTFSIVFNDNSKRKKTA